MSGVFSPHRLRFFGPKKHGIIHGHSQPTDAGTVTRQPRFELCSNWCRVCTWKPFVLLFCLPKEGSKFQSRQGTFGFQVYIDIFLCIRFLLYCMILDDIIFDHIISYHYTLLIWLYHLICFHTICICLHCKQNTKLLKQMSVPHDSIIKEVQFVHKSCYKKLKTGWWFQTIWNILVQLDHFPK